MINHEKFTAKMLYYMQLLCAIKLANEDTENLARAGRVIPIRYGAMLLWTGLTVHGI